LKTLLIIGNLGLFPSQSDIVSINNQEIKFNHSNLTNNSFSKRDGIFEVNKPLFNQVDSDTYTKSNILNKINN
jgi:hypothetical protein